MAADTVGFVAVFLRNRAAADYEVSFFRYLDGVVVSYGFRFCFTGLRRLRVGGNGGRVRGHGVLGRAACQQQATQHQDALSGGPGGCGWAPGFPRSRARVRVQTLLPWVAMFRPERGKAEAKVARSGPSFSPGSGTKDDDRSVTLAAVAEFIFGSGEAKVNKRAGIDLWGRSHESGGRWLVAGRKRQVAGGRKQNAGVRIRA